ncbi:MAG TPA: TIGR03936 family radical SAM-associated protein [Microthrixaceae bacterium]|nr:TIGR03936 family radical SAM-associated protein [Microthrixaceae bacterium]
MRVRLRHTKLGKVRFVSHRDLARVWERTVRKASLPIAYSEGFSPRPKLHFGLALSVGHESLAEYIDIDLSSGGGVAIEELPELVSAVLPDGIDVTGARQVADNEPALQAVVSSVTWRFRTPETDASALGARLDSVLAAETMPLAVVRKGKPQEVDLRPQLLRAEITGSDGVTGLEVDLATEGRSVRPDELLAALEVPVDGTRVLRVEQWMNVDGLRQPPLPAEPSRSLLAEAIG